MGTDIHWFIERRAASGAWHVVDSERRLIALRWADRRRPDGSYRAGYAMGSRDYDLFAALSGVRGNPENDTPLMNEGLPEDASEHVRSEARNFGRYAHNWGWASGEVLLAWRAHPNICVARWVRNVLEHMDDSPVDEIIPLPVTHNFDLAFLDQIGGESSHEALARAAISETLIDWRADPGAWRIVVCYES